MLNAVATQTIAVISVTIHHTGVTIFSSMFTTTNTTLKMFINYDQEINFAYQKGIGKATFSEIFIQDFGITIGSTKNHLKIRKLYFMVYMNLQNCALHLGARRVNNRGENKKTNVFLSFYV